MASILQEYGARVGLNFAVNRMPADGYFSTHWMRHPMSFGSTNPRRRQICCSACFINPMRTGMKAAGG